MISFGSLASLCFLIPTAPSINVVLRDSVPKPSARLLPDSFESHSPNNQHAASLNTSLRPAEPPIFAHNVSALMQLGLDVNSSISWWMSARSNAIGVQCNSIYGQELDIDDCNDAWEYLSLGGTTEHSYAMRGTGHRFSLPLPRRVLGCSSLSY